MSYTKTPTGDTYGTKVVNLFYPWDNRTDGINTFDTLFKNLIAEPVGNGEYYQLIKRDGSETFALNTPVVGTIIGCYYWLGPPPANLEYLVIISCQTTGAGAISFYDMAGNIQFTTALFGMGYTGDMPVTWSEFLYQDGHVDLLFTCNGSLFRATNSPPALPGNTQATSVTSAINSVTFLDGYAFVADNNSVWNSALNDPTMWPVSGFLAADAYPDSILRMGRSGPYIVTFGKDSVQFMYDAANPTGTPLATNTGATQRIGYVGGFASSGDSIYFIGTSSGSNPSLYKLTGLNIEMISSFQFTRFWLQEASMFSNYTRPPDGHVLELCGHSCYYVRTRASPFSVGSFPVNIGGFSYVYDMDSKQWSQLGHKGTEKLLIQCATQIPNQQGIATMTYFGILGDSAFHRFNPVYYMDDGENLEVRFRTRPLDFGTYRIKFCSRVMIQADNANFPAFCTLRWSDNDYASYGGLLGLGRQIPLNNQLKQTWALGNFRARSWELSFSGSYPMRFRALEVEYNLGQA